MQIPPEERDPNLSAKLKAEWPALGDRRLSRTAAIGLAPPAIVTKATEEYFDDQDTIKQWLEDRTEEGGPYAFTPTSQLCASWKLWCDERNLGPGAVSDALRRGYRHACRALGHKSGHDGSRNVAGIGALPLPSGRCRPFTGARLPRGLRRSRARAGSLCPVAPGDVIQFTAIPAFSMK